MQAAYSRRLIRLCIKEEGRERGKCECVCVCHYIALCMSLLFFFISPAFKQINKIKAIFSIMTEVD